MVLRALAGTGAIGIGATGVMAWQFDFPSWGQVGQVAGWFGGGMTVIKLVDLIIKRGAAKDTFTADLQSGLRAALVERLEKLETADRDKQTRIEAKDGQINALMVLNAELRGMVTRLTEENVNLRNRHHRFGTAVQVQFERLREGAGLPIEHFQWPEWIAQDVEGPTRDEARQRRLPPPQEPPE